MAGWDYLVHVAGCLFVMGCSVMLCGILLLFHTLIPRRKDWFALLHTIVHLG